MKPKTLEERKQSSKAYYEEQIRIAKDVKSCADRRLKTLQKHYRELLRSPKKFFESIDRELASV